LNTNFSPGATSETIAHAGSDRLVVSLDPGAGARRRVIVSLHGSGFTSLSHHSMADGDDLSRSGALVLTPQALIPFRYGTVFPEGFAWNVPGAPLPGEDTLRDWPDDVGFVTTLLKATRARHPDLPVHLLGYSGGARLASHVLAVDRTPTSAGLVAGALFPRAAESAVAAVLAIHGRHDDVNPYEGGAGVRWPTGVRRTMQSWADRSGDDATHHVCELQPGVVEQRFHSSESPSGIVRLVSLDHVGHTWPGTRDPLCLRQFGPAGTWSATSHLGTFFAEMDGGAPWADPRRSGRTP
jgi:poly(3-hydroxybutyrate) depolymerase